MVLVAAVEVQAVDAVAAVPQVAVDVERAWRRVQAHRLRAELRQQRVQQLRPDRPQAQQPAAVVAAQVAVLLPIRIRFRRSVDRQPSPGFRSSRGPQRSTITTRRTR